MAFKSNILNGNSTQGDLGSMASLWDEIGTQRGRNMTNASDFLGSVFKDRSSLYEGKWKY
jgi:hypothetical protein